MMLISIMFMDDTDAHLQAAGQQRVDVR